MNRMNSKYGMNYNVKSSSNQFNKILLDNVHEFRQITLADKKEWDKEMRKVAKLHRTLNIALENLSHSFSGDIVYIDRKDYVRISKMIEAFNVYINTNQLWKLEYDTLNEFKLPKSVIIKCKCGVLE
tara:strand:- start:28 stop:408 length:381 start_codon:yes stop_codon:yes gene_type:complete